ncbi:MAG: sodium-translocating pyrophosphatase [Clostridia bacterium]|jgi:K(+)-stimulated pyrophosphate-energized sodium pump|nr:sodium-translocating pyrophosphatase [Clostridia bacterium]MDH7572883.1 sodium-translocating pyrophosphatase [Clostridia bacterium]
MSGIVWVVAVGCAVGIVFALGLISYILRADAGTPAMQDVNSRIAEGAWAFIRRQYSTIGITAVVVAVIIGFLLGKLSSPVELERLGVSAFGMGWRTALAFLVGGLCSCVSGIVGMWTAVKSNVRCAAASHRGLNQAIKVALRGGAVSGFFIVTLSLLGVTVMFYAYGGAAHPEIAPHLIVAFGFGASMVALFAQLGGGIYTKAADMGADLAGKVEAGIPEDDPRNAAVIADQVGDNVGDCAGRGADLFESTAAENVGAMIIGTALYLGSLKAGVAPDLAIGWVLFPLVLRACGIIASMIGVLAVQSRKQEENPMAALNRGYYVALVLCALATVVVSKVIFAPLCPGWAWLMLAGLIGIIASILVVYITQYYTEGRYKPTKSIAEACRTGPATTIVTGMSVGFETAMPTTLIICIALGLTYWFGVLAGLDLPWWISGAYGTAVATMGMLMTCPYILAEDTFGPITDNANGINEFTKAGEHIRRVTDHLDAAGNTTKAITKGYAMVSAGLAGFLLFQAYFDRVLLFQGKEGELFNVNLVIPEVLIGAVVAIMMVFLFSAWSMRSVSGAAGKIIEEVRRQIKADPGIMAGTSRPDYARAVDITTRAALRGMIAPGLLPVLLPVAIGVIFAQLKISGFNAPAAVGSFLMVGTFSSILLASFMNNGGGAWDNAKKFIEDGQLSDEAGNVLGKGSFAHAAGVVGDTVGDPLKDTVGPSLHIVAKLIATVTLVLCPLWIL